MADHDDRTTTTIEPLRSSAARLEPMGRHSARLHDLLAQRSDLRGVHALADHFDEALSWSA